MLCHKEAAAVLPEATMAEVGTVGTEGATVEEAAVSAAGSAADSAMAGEGAQAAGEVTGAKAVDSIRIRK
jgi:hypothetical protein